MIYSYKCHRCGETVDREYKISEEKPEGFECECGGRYMRQWKAPAIKFKGPGFYSTDQWNDADEDLDSDHI